MLGEKHRQVQDGRIAPVSLLQEIPQERSLQFGEPMITFPQLGYVGRLGNQMFQIAGTIGLAKKYNTWWIFPHWDYEPFFNFPKASLSFASPEGIQRLAGDQEILDASELATHLDPRTRRFLQDLTIWEGCEDQVKQFFKPSDLAKAILNENEYWNWVWGKILRERHWVIGLHVRRGDNASRENGHLYYPLPTLDYYQRALSHLEPSMPVLIVSDEPEWCEENLVPHIDRETKVMHGITRAELQVGVAQPKEDVPMDWVDMMVMSLCQYHIIANSTYSWWAAWLGNSKGVFYPSAWYGPEIDYADHRLILPKNWTEVQV